MVDSSRQLLRGTGPIKNYASLTRVNWNALRLTWTHGYHRHTVPWRKQEIGITLHLSVRSSQCENVAVYGWAHVLN